MRKNRGAFWGPDHEATRPRPDVAKRSIAAALQTEDGAATAADDGVLMDTLVFLVESNATAHA